MLNELLSGRSLLPILTMEDGTPVTLENWADRRKEMLSLLETWSYGKTPAYQVSLKAETIVSPAPSYHEKALYERQKLSLIYQDRVFSFPIDIYKNTQGDDLPVILRLCGLRGDTKGDPNERILDHGYNLVTVHFESLVNDAHYGDYSDGLAAFFGMNDPREPAEWGKIGMWAYGCSRILDYLLTREDMDASKTILAGHSRLGKAVLWAAAQDERFYGVIDNASGYGGAATSKRAKGERVRDFIRAGSWDWFCENFQLFTDEKEDQKPYDQAFLLTLLAPRFYCMGTADEDPDSDPESMFLTALHASCAWELYGRDGLLSPDRLPVCGDQFIDGTIGFHMRQGRHAFTDENWDRYLEFLDKKLK